MAIVIGAFIAVLMTPGGFAGKPASFTATRPAEKFLRAAARRGWRVERRSMAECRNIMTAGGSVRG